MKGSTDFMEGFSGELTQVSSKLSTLAEGSILMTKEYDEFVMALWDIGEVGKYGLIHGHTLHYDIAGFAKPIKL